MRAPPWTNEQARARAAEKRAIRDEARRLAAPGSSIFIPTTYSNKKFHQRQKLALRRRKVKAAAQKIRQLAARRRLNLVGFLPRNSFTKENRQIMTAWKQRPCTDCGKRFPDCAMQADHIGVKNFGFNNLNHVTSAELQAELALCELVCANCHAVRTQLRSIKWTGQRGVRRRVPRTQTKRKRSQKQRAASFQNLTK